MANGTKLSPSTVRLRVLLVDDSPNLEVVRNHLATLLWIAKPATGPKP